MSEAYRRQESLSSSDNVASDIADATTSRTSSDRNSATGPSSHFRPGLWAVHLRETPRDATARRTTEALPRPLAARHAVRHASVAAGRRPCRPPFGLFAGSILRRPTITRPPRDRAHRRAGVRRVRRRRMPQSSAGGLWGASPRSTSRRTQPTPGPLAGTARHHRGSRTGLRAWQSLAPEIVVDQIDAVLLRKGRRREADRVRMPSSGQLLGRSERQHPTTRAGRPAGGGCGRLPERLLKARKVLACPTGNVEQASTSGPPNCLTSAARSSDAASSAAS